MPSQTEMDLQTADYRNRLAAARRRTTANQLERTLVRKGSVLSTAATYGVLNRVGVPVDVGGFPWKIAVEALALAGEGMTKGNIQAVFGGIADATAAVYVERSISMNTLIAGEDDD